MPNEAPAQGAQPAAPAGAPNATPSPVRSSLAVNPVRTAPAPAPKAAKAPAPQPEPKADDDTVTADEEVDADIPAKFRGKSAAEIAREYKKLESDRGRMANEVGQLRAAIDELLKLGIQGVAPGSKAKARGAEPDETDEPVTNDKLLSDPDKVITNKAKKAVKDELDKTQERLTKLEYEREQAAFEKRFPSYQETMGDEKFLEWVGKSQYRQKLAGLAAHKGSFEAAHELFGLWEEIQADKAPKASKTPAPKADAGQVEDAATARPGAKTSALATPVTSASKPIFKRSDIRRMFTKNRSEYNRRFAEIQDAYRENRVVD